MIFTIKQFKQYISGTKFKVITDHKALETILNWKHPTGRIARWIAIIQAEDFEIHYKKGKTNINADALSRLPTSRITCDNTTNHESTISGITQEQQAKDITMSQAQTYDLDCQDLKKAIENQDTKQYAMIEGLIYRKKSIRDQHYLQMYIPKSKRPAILKSMHDDLGQPGRKRTYYTITTLLLARIFTDVEDYVSKCDKCNHKKNPRNNKPPTQKFEPTTYPFERIGMDILGPLPKSKKPNEYILVITEYMTRWVEAFALLDQKATSIARKLLDEVICGYGVPTTILTDQGTNFTSELIREICKLYQIRKINTTPYNPRCNGLTERFNKALTTMLSMYCNQDPDNWDIFIPHMLLSYRNTLHETTKYSPYSLLFGRAPTLPIDLQTQRYQERYKTADEYAKKLEQIMKKGARAAIQNSCQAQPPNVQTNITFKKGDLVYVRNLYIKPGTTKKLTNMWQGPYEIIAKLGNTHYSIKIADEIRTINLHHMEEYKGSNKDINLEHLKIETILRRRKVKDGRKVLYEYLVQWNDKALETHGKPKKT